MTKMSFIIANPYPILTRPPRIRNVEENIFGLEDSDYDDDDNYGYGDDDDDDDYSSLKLTKPQESCVEDMNVLNSLISKHTHKNNKIPQTFLFQPFLRRKGSRKEGVQLEWEAVHKVAEAPHRERGSGHRVHRVHLR